MLCVFSDVCWRCAFLFRIFSPRLPLRHLFRRTTIFIRSDTLHWLSIRHWLLAALRICERKPHTHAPEVALQHTLTRTWESSLRRECACKWKRILSLCLCVGLSSSAHSQSLRGCSCCCALSEATQSLAHTHTFSSFSSPTQFPLPLTPSVSFRPPRAPRLPSAHWLCFLHCLQLSTVPPPPAERLLCENAKDILLAAIFHIQFEVKSLYGWTFQFYQCFSHFSLVFLFVISCPIERLINEALMCM